MNIRDLDRFEAGDEVTPETLKAKGLIRSIRKDVKLLGVGELTKKLSITVHGARRPPARRSRRPAAPSTLLKEPKVKKAKKHKATAETPEEPDEPEAEAAPEPEAEADDSAADEPESEA